MRRMAQQQLQPEGGGRTSIARVIGSSRIGVWATGAAVVLAGIAGMLAAAAPASAGLQGEFAVFSDCPTSNPAVVDCIYSNVTGGQFTLGSKTVTINKPVILQGGLTATSPKLVAAADGDTLSPTALTVPGGLLGVEGLGGEVTATAQLAGSAELSSNNVLAGSGTAVSLPLEVKLGNPILGGACYLGSTSDPIAIHLTTGTTSPPAPNTPISGAPGHLVPVAAGKILFVSGSTLVDNAFAVPGASGCGGLLSLIIDPAVDLSAGVPAAAGHNTAIMSGTLESAGAALVKAEAALPEIGRCVLAESTGSGKTAVYNGGYSDSACLDGETNKHGKYEWLAGGAANAKFSGSAKATLQGIGGGEIRCKGGTDAGGYTGAKTLTAEFALTGCESMTTKQSCQSSGAAAGEIVTSPLAGRLGFIKDEPAGGEVVASVGVDLSQSPSLINAECGGISERLEVKGSVILPISTIDKMAKSFSLKGAASAGKQSPEEFEEGVKDTLTATLGAGSEQAGLTTSDKLTNEVPYEIKAIAN